MGQSEQSQLPLEEVLAPYQIDQPLTEWEVKLVETESKALAEMGMSCEPLASFLEDIEDKPHPEYFPAEVRGEVIRDAHAGRAYRAKNRRSMFPGMERMTSAKGHLGEY